MSRVFQVLQLNVGKRERVQLSLLNDENLENFSVLAISEPHSWRDGETVVVAPMGHHNWVKFLPTAQNTVGRWAIRSMLWIRKDLEAVQITVDSSDITAAVVQLPNRAVLVASVYVPRGNRTPLALQQTLNYIQQLIRKAHRQASTRMDILIVGDFNRHDQLWGRDNILARRQGEADPIIDLMGEFSLHSLLERGTKTWIGQEGIESTVDLTLASEELAAEMIRCTTYEIEHGSDHLAIESVFDIEPPVRAVEQKLFLRNAPWKAIQERIATALQNTQVGNGIQQQADQLMGIVLDAVHALTPKAKPLPYAKRWWTKDLTNLRSTYTYLRNQARAHRRGGMATTK